MKKPRVLIFGQSFNSNTGGGVTLSNLFADWDKESLAVVVTGHAISNINFKYCENYYFIGSKENSWIFPFSLFQKKFSSGKLDLNQLKDHQSNVTNQVSFRSKFINSLFYPFLQWTGLFYVLSKVSLSSRFLDWVSDFNPEIVYIQVSTRDSLLFATALAKELKIPIVLHQMDDWLSTICYKGLMAKYWREKVNREFQNLVDISTLCMSISDLMGREYFRRYGKKFMTFHNPVDLSFWNSSEKKINLKPGSISILYAGRTGFGIGTSLRSFAQAIEELREETDLPLEFFIQTHESISWIHDFKYSHYRELVPYHELPMLFRGSDFLLLPCDFSEKAIKFLKYSMPTKAPEYMISGTPTILLSPEVTAVYQYGRNKNWAFPISDDSVSNIKKELFRLINDPNLQSELSSRALNLAMRNHDCLVIRNLFLSEFIQLLENNKLSDDQFVLQN